MIRFILSVLVTLGATVSLAQNSAGVELSPLFKAPACYRSKVILCGNGNTFLFNFRAAGSDFLLFGKDRKLIKRSACTGRLASGSSANRSEVPLLFEEDGNIVFFITQTIASQKILVRVLMDANDGTVKNEQVIASLAKASRSSSFATLFGGVHTDISVVRDRVSGNYAVIMEDGLAEDTTHKLQIGIYNRRHEKTGALSCTQMFPALKYLEYMDACFTKDVLTLCTHEYNTRSYGTEESDLVVSEIGLDGKMRQQKKLGLQPALKGFAVKMKYQQYGDRLMLAMLVPDGNYKGGYQRYITTLTALKPADFSPIYSTTLDLNALNEYNEKVCGKSRDFAGTILGWTNNSKGGINLVIAERELVFITNNQLGASTTAANNWRDIGIIELNDEGKLVGASAIQQIAAGSVGDSYISIIGDENVRSIPFGGKGVTMYEGWGNSTEATMADYIHTPSHDYFIRNHPHDEFDEPTCEKSRYIPAWRSSAALYTINAAGTPKRTLLWGPPPSTGSGYRAVMLGTSDFDPQTQTYAAVVMEADGKDLVIRMGWVHLP